MKQEISDKEYDMLYDAAEICYSQYNGLVPFGNTKLVDIEHPSGVHASILEASRKMRLDICVTGSDECRDWLLNLLAWRNSKGFYHGAFKASGFIKNPVLDFVGQYEKTQYILVCGHSIGGAIGYILALSLVNKGYQNVHLVTFGQPKTGNLSVGRRLMEGVKSYYRATNSFDPIPLVPFNLTHTGIEIIGKGTHSMRSYFRNVEDVFLTIN